MSLQKLIKNNLHFITCKNVSKAYPLPYCVPVYHNVCDHELPHLKHIIKYKSTKDFEKDLDLLSKDFQFVNWSEFKDYFAGNFKPSKKMLLLTFDDGFREFYDVAVSILERKGIYAINYVNPAFIDNQDMMFRCKASILLENILTRKTIPEDALPLLSQTRTHEERILGLKYADLTIIKELADALEVDFVDYQNKNQPYMSLEQLKSLHQKGFGVSAHSWDHPLYHEISVTKQLENTQKSLCYIQENGFEADTFAFPFTDYEVSMEFFEKLFDKKNLAFTFGTAGIKLDEFSKNIQRIPMETGEDAMNIIKKEIAYYQVKKWLNKNKISRQ